MVVVVVVVVMVMVMVMVMIMVMVVVVLLVVGGKVAHQPVSPSAHLFKIIEKFGTEAEESLPVSC